jgi:hypothetical protein
MEFCLHCLGTGKEKICTCCHVSNGRTSRCQSFKTSTCFHCGGSGEKPTWESQLYMRPDIDNDFGVYK